MVNCKANFKAFINYEVLIQKDEAVILPKKLLEFLKAALEDSLILDSLIMKKLRKNIKRKNFTELLEELHEEMQADNFLEKNGLNSEEDIADYIRQIRHEKSNS